MFSRPGTTSGRPASAASSAAVAIIEAGSTIPRARMPGSANTEEDSSPAAAAKPVSVAPGNRQVTSTPDGRSSGRMPAQKERTKALVAPYSAALGTPAGASGGGETGQARAGQAERQRQGVTGEVVASAPEGAAEIKPVRRIRPPPCSVILSANCRVSAATDPTLSATISSTDLGSCFTNLPPYANPR